MMNNKSLLPQGFYGLLPNEAKQWEIISSNLLSSFEQNGYLRVTTPIAEFEDSLFSPLNKNLQQETFRFMDSESQKMLALRSDITVQIANLASTRLKSEKRPLRLSYCGDVIKTKGSGLYRDRQLTQTGIELIGSDNVLADVEVIVVAIEAIRNIGIKDLSIDFTLPGLKSIIINNDNLSNDEKILLEKALRKKDINAIKKFANEQTDLLLELADTSIDLSKLKSLKLPKEAITLVNKLEQIITEVNKQIDINITVDPVESGKFLYHSGVGFSIFSAKAKSELGRGGRYNLRNDEPAVGFSLFVNELLRVSSFKEKQKRIYVEYGTNRNDITKLQNEGYITVISLEENKSLEFEAKEQHCEFVFKDGKIN